MRIAFARLLRTHTDMVAVTFPQVELIGQKPSNPAYPEGLLTIGDHIRKRRLDLGLFQKDVAKIIGTSTDSITFWEKGRHHPALSWYPAIIQFLGYVPFEIGETAAEKFLAYRKIRGISRLQAA